MVLLSFHLIHLKWLVLYRQKVLLCSAARVSFKLSILRTSRWSHTASLVHHSLWDYFLNLYWLRYLRSFLSQVHSFAMDNQMPRWLRTLLLWLCTSQHLQQFAVFLTIWLPLLGPYERALFLSHNCSDWALRGIVSRLNWVKILEIFLGLK